MYIDIFKIILLALLTFPSISGQASSGDDDTRCGLRPANYYVKRSQQRNSDEELTERENFPWHVSIFRRANKDASFAYECGGTLIPGPGKDLLVLTAASCVTQSLKSAELDPNYRRNIRVVAGSTSSNYNGNSEFAGAQKFAVKRIEINPLYEPVGLKSDAAIIQLDGRVATGKYAKPACLPPNNIELNQVRFGMIGEIAGFNWDIRRNISEKLWFAKYPVTTGAVCEDKLQLKVNEFLEFCTGYQKETQACQGDSGSGLVFQYPQIGGRYYVHGVLSFVGKTPVLDGFCENYNIFQRVGPLLQWVKEVQDKIAKDDRPSSDLGSVQPTTPLGPPPHRLFPEYAKVGRDFHNHYRGVHRSEPLKLSEKIQESAQKLAETLAARENLNVPESIYSTNVFAIPGVVPANQAVREAVQYWYRSFTDYKREDPKPNAFTNMVWRASNEVGIGTATDGEKTVVVANYFPKGNVYYEGGKYFERTKSFGENVKAILPGYL